MWTARDSKEFVKAHGAVEGFEGPKGLRAPPGAPEGEGFAAAKDQEPVLLVSVAKDQQQQGLVG